MTATLGAAFSTALNVRSYGARGDGVSDDRAAIQAAIDAANALYNSAGVPQVVTGPPGPYFCNYGGATTQIQGTIYTPALVIKAGVIIEGLQILTPAISNTTISGNQSLAGSTITVASTAGFASAGNLQFAGNSDIVTYTGKSGTTFTGCSGGSSSVTNGTAVVQRTNQVVFATPIAEHRFWKLRGCVIDAGNPSSVVVEIDAPAVMVAKASDWSIERCEIKRSLGKAVEIHGDGVSYIPARWRISGCDMHDVVSNAIGFSLNGAREFWITDNDIHDNRSSTTGAESIIGLTNANQSQGVIARNHIINWGTLDVGGTDVLIADNTINALSGQGGPGIRVGIGTRVRVLNNAIDMSAASSSTARCVDFSGSPVTDCVIAGNTLNRAAGAAAILSFPGSGRNARLVVSDNTITGGTAGSSEATIQVSNTDDLVIKGNVMQAGTTNIVSIGNTTTKLSFADNVLEGGEAIIGVAGCSIVGNVITASATTEALRVIAAKTTVTGNRLYGGSNPTPVLVMATGAQDCVVSGNSMEGNGAFVPMVTEQGSSDRNLYTANHCVFNGNPNGGFVLAGTASIVRGNYGWVTENGGSASKANGNTIAHGLAKTPTKVSLTASAAKRELAVTAIDATNLTIALHDDTGTAVAAAETVYWRAEV